MSKLPKQKFSTIVGNNFAMLKIVAKYTPEYIFLMIAEGVIWGLINASMSIYNLKLLNTVEKNGNYVNALIIIGIMALFIILAFAFDKWYWCIKNPIIRQKLQLKMQSDLLKKAITLDIACYDDPEFYNDFVLAMEQSETRACDVLEDTGKLINRLVACSAMFSVLFTIDPIIAVILLISSIISTVGNIISNKYVYNHRKEGNPIWRKLGYINRVYRFDKYAKEIRITNADEILQKEYDDSVEDLITLQKKYGKKYFIFNSITWSTVGVATYFFLIIYLLISLQNGTVTVGGIAATVNVVWSIRWQFFDLISRITKYPLHSLFIEKFLEFLRFTPTLHGEITDIPPFESLELKNVSFCYEFTNHPKYKYHTEDELKKQQKYVPHEALKNVNLKITAGEKIAIVGYNGAGKSTLIKLILRLYDPTDGTILYNGIDIKNFEPNAYRKKIGVVFQDYKIFATSIAQNVMSGEYNENTDKEKILDALYSADFSEKLKALPDGINTALTREFDDNGTNLSGGEQQKVAIARAFASNAPLLIMDEPSSALDPIAEYELNQSVLKKTADKTVIFISHRLSTTRIADKIYMFDSGRLIEDGSHSQLMQKGGKYAEMFELQAKKVQTER